MPPRTRPKAKPWSRPLADLVGPAIDPVLARQGFSEAELILQWEDIVGERLAASSRLVKLQWPPRPAGARPDAPVPTATLVVRVEGAFAIELQHMAEQVLARINAHLGWRCVGRLVFKQGPLERTDLRRSRTAPPLPATPADVTSRVTGVADEGLRDALTRLGARIAEKTVRGG